MEFRSIRTAFLLLALCISPGVLAADDSAYQHKPVSIGVNKFDLFMQYTGTASGGDGGPAYRRVTRAMARKSLDDAKDAGVTYMRVSMSGRTSFRDGDGRDSLALWLTDQESFWKQVDEMMDDLDAHGIQIIPVMAWATGKFPAIAGEPLSEMLRDPDSESWRLLSRYITEFVTRYRKRHTVLFYELTNELNNYADLDLVKRCKRKETCEEGDRFITADMIAYTRRMASLIRSLDRGRKISSGFSIPRGSAEHLRARPEWTTARTDWRPDSREQFEKNLAEIHAAVDIISIHLYSGAGNRRFGSDDPLDLLAIAKNVADKLGKPLFVGEFGDPPHSDASAGRAYSLRMMDKIQELDIPYSAFWVWELYQKNTYTTHDNKHTTHSLEPGYTDDTIQYLRNINFGGKHGMGSGVVDVTPPRVVLSWPLECGMLSKKNGIHAVASDDAGAILKVEFLLDDHSLAEDDTVPFETTYTGRKLTPGKYRLTARAYDVAGNISEFSTTVVTAKGVACVLGME